MADDPLAGSGLAFICPLANAYQALGMCRGYRVTSSSRDQDFDRAIALARTYNDRQMEAASHGNLALLEAVTENYESALDHAWQGLVIAEEAGDEIHVIACSVPTAVAQAGRGLFQDALARAEGDLVTIRTHRIGLYYEPVLLATIARSKLGLGDAEEALAAAEEAVTIADDRGLTACALVAPITLAQVLAATQGTAAEERIDTVLSRAMDVARKNGGRVFERLIDREFAGRQSPPHPLASGPATRV